MSLRHTMLLAALLLADCGTSPKTQYFTLDAVPGGGAKASIATPVTVATVSLPPSLDRSAMVHRTGATTVEISDQDRWTSPLGDMTRRVLTQDLAARLPEDKVILPDQPAPPHTARLVVSITQFGSDGSGRIVLSGGWSLVKGGSDTPVLRRDFTLAAPAAAEGGGVQAAGMSQLLGRLASEIASALPATL